MENTINLGELGCVNQGEDFYTDLDNKFKMIDELDKSRTLLHLSTLIISQEMKIHPLVIMKIIENIQNCEINCAKIKQTLADVKVDNIICKLCNYKLPTMTMRMFCEGINAKCPHNEIEIEINEKTN